MVLVYAGIQASLNNPNHIAARGMEVYIADQDNQRIRMWNLGDLTIKVCVARSGSVCCAVRSMMYVNSQVIQSCAFETANLDYSLPIRVFLQE